MKVLRWIRDTFCYGYRRWIDMRVLWPSIKKHAKGDMLIAREAFYLHTLIDPAWHGLSNDERVRQVEALE